MRPTPDAAALRRQIAALPITIEAVACAVHAVPVPSYPDGPRPSSTVTLRGGGCAGRGEHVGWTTDAHQQFTTRAEHLELTRCVSLADVAALLSGALDDAYDRAALEAAAIDLALRQAGTNLATLSGSAPRPLRYVVSFEKVADPLARAAHELDAAAPGVELKIDVDPHWSDATFAALAALGRVCVLDFKQSGAVAEHERIHRLVPAALLEDPLPGPERWSASLRGRLSFDAPVHSAAALATLAERPAAVNVKPARLGSVLGALDVIATCAAQGIAVYFGGMFEVGVGRSQLQTLAALLCPDAPNDLAPIARDGRPAVRPARLDVAPADVGFADW